MRFRLMLLTAQARVISPVASRCGLSSPRAVMTAKYDSRPTDSVGASAQRITVSRAIQKFTTPRIRCNVECVGAGAKSAGR